MSVLKLSGRRTVALGAACSGAAAALYAVGATDFAAHGSVAAPFHFAQGILLGAGLALSIGGLIKQRRGG